MSAHVLSLVSLFLVGLATCLVPGPNNFMLMRLGMRRGRAAAMAAGFGTTLSCIVWCAAAALGLAALLKAWPWLYLVMRIGGGLYLIWFAVAIWRARPEPPPDEVGPLRTAEAFWQGFAINMTNPKSALFFAAVFSPYVGPQTPDWVRYAAIVVVIFTCQLWQTVMAVLFSSKGPAAAYARAQRPLDRIAAVLMAGFGASLVAGLA